MNPIPPPERTGRSTGFKIALVVLAVLLVLGVAGVIVASRFVTIVASVSSGEETDSSYSAGDEATTRADRSTVAGKTKESLKPGSGQLLPNPVLARATKVEILANDRGLLQIEVQSGSFKGQKLWVHAEDLQ
ncbi:MAG TPA: hypothetical protein VMI31_12715 [Fimbriimonadaceae bacterium]|nr:hypothetical protein [Fimbriimonadaceae bacterium]